MKRAITVVALAAGGAACTGEPVAPPQVDAAIVRSTDTIRFKAPAVLYRCAGGVDLLLEAVARGNGVLVWLRLRDSLAPTVPIIGMRDTVTRPGAVVAVRYSHESVTHTVSLDSGTVTVSDSGDGGARRLAVAGSGLDVGFGVRAGVAATFGALPATADSTALCTRKS